MTRRATTYVPKRPHKKSRGGCQTCKRKKVKCDEIQPRCSYCELRNITCIYPLPAPKKNVSPANGLARLNTDFDPIHRNRDYSPSENSSISPVHLPTPTSMLPATRTSSGLLTPIDMQLLHHYHSVTWRTLTLRNDRNILSVHQNLVPQIGMSHSYLLSAVLSITASHRNALAPSKQAAYLADLYRQKAIVAYNRALSNVTAENYESLLTTSLFMGCMLSYPDPRDGEERLWDWVCTFLTMSQGLRILASLKFAASIGSLSVAPVFLRDLKPLPPAPDEEGLREMCFFGKEEEPTTEQRRRRPEQLPNSYPSHPTPPDSPDSLNGHTPTKVQHIPHRPNPISPTSIPSTPHRQSSQSQSRTQTQSQARPQNQQPLPFLPPPLLSLLSILTSPSTSRFPHPSYPQTHSPSSPDAYNPTLLTALLTLSPLFLSLYHFRLSTDLYTRIVTWPTFLSPSFTQLVREKEPRALVILAWWFSLVELVPGMWWVRGLPGRVLGVVERTLTEVDRTKEYGGEWRWMIEGAVRVVRVGEERGVEEGAREFWRGWRGLRGWGREEGVVFDDID